MHKLQSNVKYLDKKNFNIIICVNNKLSDMGCVSSLNNRVFQPQTYSLEVTIMYMYVWVILNDSINIPINK